MERQYLIVRNLPPKHLFVSFGCRLLLPLVVCCFFSSCERHRTEGAVIATRAIRKAQNDFHENNRRYGLLTELAAAGLIDDSLEDGRVYGHVFELSPSNDKYHLLVIPENLEEIRRDALR